MLDRLDRLVLAGLASRADAGTVPPPLTSNRAELAGTPVQPVVPPKHTAAMVIHSVRGPRFVDYMPCPMCSTQRVGVEFHGVLMSGAKVHQLYSHSPGLARVDRKAPRCLGAGMRVVFVGGNWRGEQS